MASSPSSSPWPEAAEEMGEEFDASFADDHEEPRDNEGSSNYSERSASRSDDNHVNNNNGGDDDGSRSYFSDEDGPRSYYSGEEDNEGSRVSGSYRDGEDGERSYFSGKEDQSYSGRQDAEGGDHDDNDSYATEEGSNDQKEGSSYTRENGDDSYRLEGEGSSKDSFSRSSQLSGQRSFQEDDRSQDVPKDHGEEEQSYYDDDGSAGEEESYYSDERSYYSDERSYYSDERSGSKRSVGDGSFGGGSRETSSRRRNDEASFSGDEQHTDNKKSSWWKLDKSEDEDFFARNREDASSQKVDEEDFFSADEPFNNDAEPPQNAIDDEHDPDDVDAAWERDGDQDDNDDFNAIVNVNNQSFGHDDDGSASFADSGSFSSQIDNDLDGDGSSSHRSVESSFHSPKDDPNNSDSERSDCLSDRSPSHHEQSPRRAPETDNNNFDQSTHEVSENDGTSSQSRPPPQGSDDEEDDISHASRSPKEGAARKLDPQSFSFEAFDDDGGGGDNKHIDNAFGANPVPAEKGKESFDADPFGGADAADNEFLVVDDNFSNGFGGDGFGQAFTDSDVDGLSEAHVDTSGDQISSLDHNKKDDLFQSNDFERGDTIDGEFTTQTAGEDSRVSAEFEESQNEDSLSAEIDNADLRNDADDNSILDDEDESESSGTTTENEDGRDNDDSMGLPSATPHGESFSDKSDNIPAGDQFEAAEDDDSHGSLPGFQPISFPINEPNSEKRTLIILCSMFPSSKEEASQDSAMKLCRAKGIVPHILMGQQKPPQRDELLRVSKAEGFPQFFLYWQQSVEFLGGFETIRQMDENDEFNPSVLEHSPGSFAGSEFEEETLGEDEARSTPSDAPKGETNASQGESVFQASFDDPDDVSSRDDEEDRSQSLDEGSDQSRSFEDSGASTHDTFSNRGNDTYENDTQPTIDDYDDENDEIVDSYREFDGKREAIANGHNDLGADFGNGSMPSEEVSTNGEDQFGRSGEDLVQNDVESLGQANEESLRSAQSFQESFTHDGGGSHQSASKSFRSATSDSQSKVQQQHGATDDGHTSVSESQHSQSIEPSISMRSVDKKNDEFEQSMMIGEVFGQPNELFDDYKHKKSLASVGEEDDQSSEGSPGGSASLESAERSAKGPSQPTESAFDEGQSDEEGVEDHIIDAHDDDRASVDRSEHESELDDEIEAKPMVQRDKSSKKSRKKKRKKRRKEAKSPALLDFAANVNDAMLDLEEMTVAQDLDEDSSAYRLLHGFDALLGIFLQLSDELELTSTFAKLKKKKDKDAMVPVQALKAVLSFADTFDQLFADLMPIILDCLEEEPDEEMDDLLYRLNSIVDLLCETTDRVGEKQEWNERAETTYVTLLELMERDSLDLRCIFEDVDTPDQGLSANIHEAWSATGHIEELRALQYAEDPWLFRQICYEVMVSTDQWCPDTSILMEICGVDPEMLEEEPDPEYLEEEELAPIPQAAEHVLDKVNGDPIPRPEVMASILRRIIPPRAVTDATLLDNFTSIRNTLQNPLGLSATNIVSISSIAETLNDPEALGVGGMGKTTLAAMVAQHPDVRRYFIDGVVWVYVGDKELTYSRYTQCLRELVAQLDFYQGVPLFAELLHTPGEPFSKRRRREEGFMIYARDTIAELLHDRSVLIILDDVCFEPDLDWFDFAPMPGESMDDQESNCALLVTTRCRSLLPAADTVEVDMLDEADAISLLIQESGQLSHALMAESKEARAVVRECADHPLAVKSVGRWLNLKHATAGVVSSVEEIHSEVIKSMDKILKGGDHTGADMMYEVLSMSLSPAINGEPTSIIKFCLAAFITVFCDREYISDFALTEPTPIIPMDMAELLFETLLEMNESSLLQKGSLFYAQKKEAAVLIPEALSALGVLKVITYSDAEDDEENPEDEQKFLQVMHFIHHEYGEYLAKEELALQDLTKDAERQWNRALVEAYLSHVEEWDMDLEDAAHSYALEMIISHMIRGGMYSAAADLLADKSFVRGRLLSLGRENSTRRHIKDCETLFAKLRERRPRGSKLEPRNVMKQAYQALGSQLTVDDEDQGVEDSRIKDVEVARAHYEIGFSLAEKRCWDAAIAHWETSQELLVSALGTVEVVAGILYNIGVVFSEMNEYEQALDSLKQCLRIRGTIHGEEHILYAQTIQKIGDIFLSMSDYHEAMESYNWALDVMYTEPSHHRVEIGEILDNKGTIHYSKAEIDEALQCHQEALRSKQVDLGEDHPELAATYHHIGNCLSDQGNVDDAIVHFEEAIRLKELDPEGGPERDADVLTIEGILHNLEGNQDQGLECYEKALQIFVTKVPHRKEKVASLLHLIGCVYLMSGEQKKAMKLFEESLQARRKVLGFVHLDVASTLFNMAFLHQTRNRLDRALKCLEEALKIRQLRLPDSEKVAVTHEKIGSLARAIGKTKKAQIAFEEALRIRRLIHGEQHEAVATVLQELGDLMDDLGEYDSAMSYYIDALDIRRNRLGLDDIAVAETLYSMGYTLHNNDEPERALVCFEESLSIRRYQLGEDSKEVGDTLNMMGFLKAKKGELDDAITLLWDALRIRKLQEDHVKVSETLKNIGNVHREKQEQELAVECYEECLRIRRAELGPEHEKVADALIAMGNVQSDMQRTEEAMRSYQEALKIRTFVFGEHDESVAAVLQYMGTMEFRAGNHIKARDLLTEFIRIRRDNGTKSDGDYVNVLFMIGNIHKMQGREAEARLCWTEAYQVFQELGLAETNPQIAKVMNHLLKVENLEEQEQEQKGKSVFAKVTEKFKSKNGDEPQKGRKRRKGKGVQL